MSPAAMAERIAELEAHVRRLLDYEQQVARGRGLSDCTCCGFSGATERAYDLGECPHQLATQALRSPHAD